MSEKRAEFGKRLRTGLLLLMDAVLVNLSVFLALYLREELSGVKLLSSRFFPELVRYAPIHTVAALLILFAFKMYNNLWEFAGTDDLIRITAASLTVAASHWAGMAILGYMMPRSLPFINAVLLILMEGFSRLYLRVVRETSKRRLRQGMKRTMLIGAGDAGAMALNEFRNSAHSKNNVVCVIDDDKRKVGQYFHGVKIVGTREKIPEAARSYGVDEIVIAIPTASSGARRELIELCGKTPCKLKILPAIYQLANGEVNVQRIRNVDVEDLLGRDSVRVNLSNISSDIRGKVVLVTGGGGSIGSELCRQIASFAPKKLVIFDIYENNAYAIQQELLRTRPNLSLEVLIGSVRDRARLDDVFETYRPQIVYHAAAHKHVPLMEESPNEAIKNNVFGTLNVARAADQYGACRFVLVSTDKAVRPTNVMGASKRICEMIIQMMNKSSKTDYVAVRFGNVLGSNGSVIPLFRDQIARGGPVTVTHKDIIRYFMTIPEAVSLILEAGVYAEGGEIFVLDMGDPVRIDNLARNMIRLSGFEPDVDIDVVYTGLRPGEKLYEELLLDEEGLTRTANDLIYIGHPIDFDERVLRHKLDDLWEACSQNDADIRNVIKKIVPEFHPSDAEGAVCTSAM